MSDDRLDLRDLSEVDSPEVVSAALAQFRRRMWTRYLWVLAIVAAVGVLAWQVTRPDDLRQRIERADPISANALYAGGSARIGIDEVGDLGETVGLRLVVLPEPGSDVGSESGSGPRLRVDGTVQQERTGAFDRWFEIEPRRRGRACRSAGARLSEPGGMSDRDRPAGARRPRIDVEVNDGYA